MAPMEIIEHRHSISRYLDKPFERDKIIKCLEVARLAPSASNGQTARFVVVDEPVLKKTAWRCSVQRCVFRYEISA